MAGLPRFAKNMPCNSAALRRMPACFIATFRSGPGGIVRARSSAASASASRSSFGRGFLFGRGMEPKIRQIIPACLFGARLWNQSGNETAIATGTLPALSRRRPLNRRPRKGVIDGAQRKECPMIRHLAVIGTLAAFAGAPAMAQQPTAPGQVMHKSGSVSKGASAYAPGHLKKHRLAIRGRPGASGYAPGHAAETNINTRSGMTTGSSVNTRSGMTTGSSANTRSDVTTGSTAPSRRIDTGSQR